MVGRERSASLGGDQEVAFAGAERYRRFNQLSEAAQRVLNMPGVLDRRRQVLGDALLQRGRSDEVGFGRKPAVERSFADPGVAGNGLDRGIRPEFAVHLPCGAQDARGIALRRLATAGLQPLSSPQPN